MATANLSIVTFVLAVYAILLVEAKPVSSGLLLAISFCLKLTVAAPVLLLLLFFRRWRALFTCAGASGAIAGGALLWLHHCAGWYGSYKANVTYLFGPNGAASFITQKGGRFDLLNLQVPIYGMTGNANVSNALAFGVAAALFTLWVWRYKGTAKITWSASGSVGLIGLLPIYQRNYSAGFVLLAVLWATKFFHANLRARVLLALSLLLLVPGEAILRDYSNRLPTILRAPMVENVVLAYASWVIVAMTVLILWKVGPEEPI